MKLHLPTKLRAALLAVVTASVTLPSTAQAITNGAVYQPTYFQHAAQVHANLSNDANAYQNPDTPDDPDARLYDEYNFRSPVISEKTGDFFNANKNDWTLTIEVHDFLPRTNAATGKADNAVIIGNAKSTTNTNGNTTLFGPDAFSIDLDRFGNVRLLINEENKSSRPERDITLFSLDTSWDEKILEDAETVSFRLTLSWDADGGLIYDYDEKKDQPKRYGALSLQSAQLLSNDENHSVIKELDSFYTGHTILDNSIMPENFLSLDKDKDGGCYTISGEGGTAVVSLMTEGNTPAWCVYGKTSLAGLIDLNEEGVQLAPLYKDVTDTEEGRGAKRFIKEDEYVQFMGNNSTLWLKRSEAVGEGYTYTYNHRTWASMDPHGLTDNVGIGFGADAGTTIIVDKSVIASTVIASGATVNAQGEGTVKLIIDTGDIESVDVPVVIAPPEEEEEEEEIPGNQGGATIPDGDTDDGLAGGESDEGGEGEIEPPTITVVPDIPAGERYIGFNKIDANTTIELEVIGNRGVTIGLGNATIGNQDESNTTSITRTAGEEGEIYDGALNVQLHNGSGTSKVSYVGSISNEEGNLKFIGQEQVNIYNEDHEFIETKTVNSSLVAKTISATGNIDVSGVVAATELIHADKHVTVNNGRLWAKNLEAGGQLTVGEDTGTKPTLTVTNKATIGGSVDVYGAAEIGELETTGVVIHNTGNPDAKLIAGSISADYIVRELTVTPTDEDDAIIGEDSYQNIHIGYKDGAEKKEALLSDGVSIDNNGIKAGKIAADTQIFIAAESTSGVTINDVNSTDIQIGTDGQGNRTTVMTNVTGAAVVVNPNGGQGLIGSAGNLEATTLELPTGYTLDVDGTLTVENGIETDGLTTTGRTIATDIVLTDIAVAAIDLDETEPAIKKGLQVSSLKADSLEIADGGIIYLTPTKATADAVISTTDGMKMGDNATLANITGENGGKFINACISGTITAGNAAYIYGITNMGEMETGEGSILINSTIGNTYKTHGTTTLTNIKVDNASFGGAEGTAFYSENVGDSMTLTGVISEDESGSVTLNVTNMTVDASTLTFTEEGEEVTYTILAANGNNSYSVDDNLTEDITAPAYTWATIVSDGKTISVSGVYNETLYKKQLVGDSENRANTMAALEENAAVEGSVAAQLHDTLGDVMKKSLKNRQEILDAISGASISALADSQRRGVQDVQSSLRNRIIQMGGTRDEESMGIQAWAQADSSFTSSNSGDEAVGYDYNTWGATVGANVDLSENVVVGMSFSASYGELDVDSADKATGNNDAYYVNFFTRHQTGRWTQLLILTVGSNDMDLTRKVDTYTAEGSTSGSSYSAYYELGYTLGLTDDFTHVIQPMVSASITSAKVDGYKESGTIGNAGLEYDGNSYVYGTVGIGLRYQGVLFESIFERNGVLELRGQVTQDFGDTTDEATVSMAGGKPGSVYGTDTSGTGFNVGAGLSIPVQMQTTIFADADMTIRTDYTGFRASVGFRYDF